MLQKTKVSNKVDWATFFPPGTRVVALPSWRRPRLYLPSYHFMQRWEHSAFYPASRLEARAVRALLRLTAATNVARKRVVDPGDWPLGEFVRDELPQLATAAVLMGSSGPAQEATVQMWDKSGRIIGYLKYAEKDAARKRLRQEAYMISRIPDGMGPKPIRHERLGDGDALLKSVVHGAPLKANLPAPADLGRFANMLIGDLTVPLEQHPWVRRLYAASVPELDDLLEPLANREWPIAIQHGDFAPWNILRQPDGQLRAVDWEYGTLEGFPFLDLAHYVLQVSALIYRRSPERALRRATDYLLQESDPKLEEVEARALVRLAVYDAYRHSLEDGQRSDRGLQAWRQAAWRSDLFRGSG